MILYIMIIVSAILGTRKFDTIECMLVLFPPSLLSRCVCRLVFWVSLYYLVIWCQGTPIKASPDISHLAHWRNDVFFCSRVFSDAASKIMPCTRVHGRGTAWSTEPTETAANTAVCRSAWRSAWAAMVSLNVKLAWLKSGF